jgi:hypothetical protein
MDISPLSKINLAQVFQIGGRLEEARLYAEDSLKAGDHSWMLNYGIDPVRYRRDIHEILKDTCQGMMKAEAFKAPGTIAEKILGPFRIAGYWFRAEVHGQLFRKYSLLSAQAYPSETGLHDMHLEPLIQYYKAFEAYPRRALDYLERARFYEETRIPESGPYYDLKEGILLKDQTLIRRALEGLDLRWQRDLIAKAYTELAKKGLIYPEAGEQLFALNRGALRQNGISLELELQIDGFPPRTHRILEKAVQQAGIRRIQKERAGNPRYVLILSGGEKIVNCELRDSGRRVFRQGFSLPSLSAADQAAFSRALGNTIFDGFSSP